MDEQERERILTEARANIGRLADDRAELEARRLRNELDPPREWQRPEPQRSPCVAKSERGAGLDATPSTDDLVTMIGTIDQCLAAIEHRLNHLDKLFDANERRASSRCSASCRSNQRWQAPQRVVQRPRSPMVQSLARPRARRARSNCSNSVSARGVINGRIACLAIGVRLVPLMAAAVSSQRLSAAVPGRASRPRRLRPMVRTTKARQASSSSQAGWAFGAPVAGDALG